MFAPPFLLQALRQGTIILILIFPSGCLGPQGSAPVAYHTEGEGGQLVVTWNKYQACSSEEHTRYLDRRTPIGSSISVQYL